MSFKGAKDSGWGGQQWGGRNIWGRENSIFPLSQVIRLMHLGTTIQYTWEWNGRGHELVRVVVREVGESHSHKLCR